MASQSLGDLFTCAKNSKINLSNRQLKYLGKYYYINISIKYILIVNLLLQYLT